MIVKLSKKAECELNKLAPIVMRQIVTHKSIGHRQDIYK